MAYKRITEDEFQIHGNYGQGFEELTYETTRKKARTQLRLYREAEPGIVFKMVIKRIKINTNVDIKKTYRIVRMYKTDAPKSQPKELPTGLSLREAKEYCKNDATQDKD